MNDALATRLLRAYFDEASQYGNLPATFEEFLAVVNSNPNFLSNFGNTAFIAQQGVGADGVTEAMQNLANTTKGLFTQYPDGMFKGSEFGDALYNKVSDWDLKRIVTTTAEIAGEGVTAIADTAKIAGTLYIVISAAGIGLALYLALKSSGRAAKAAV